MDHDLASRRSALSGWLRPQRPEDRRIDRLARQHGNLFSSASGYITTPTYYSQKDSNRETVSVKVVIGGVAGTDAANCD
ncbi:hypothetical protein ABY45_09940 [Microbacterium maritypicum]|uniref:hypothetical protein n=1 Tax=Microbacterium maritypicum TaxID=33918 RepID=UPI003D6EE8EA